MNAIIAHDDRVFFEEFYEKYKRMIYLTTKRYEANPEQQEEIMQNALLKLIEKIDVIRELTAEQQAAYIGTTIRNLCINNYHHQKNREVQLTDDQWECYGENVPDSEEVLLGKENLDELRTVLGRLSAFDRFLLEGRYILGLSTAELSRAVGCRQSCVATRIFRAKKRAIALLTIKEG